MWKYQCILFSLMFLLSIQSSGNELVASITTHLGNNKTFHSGDQFSLLISQSHSSYAIIIYENANAELIQIFPNRLENKNQLEKGRYYPLKFQNETLWFSIAPPFGKETLWLFSSLEKFPNFEQDKKNIGVYSIYRMTIDQFIQKLNHYFKTKNSSLVISKTQLITLQ